MKINEWKNIYHGRTNQKKAGIAVLVSDKVDCKTRTITGNKEGHFMMVKDFVGFVNSTKHFVSILYPNLTLNTK